MLGYNGGEVPDTLFEGLTVKEHPDETAAEFEKLIRYGYEQARKKGLAPNAALAILLAWAAEESERLERR